MSILTLGLTLGTCILLIQLILSPDQRESKSPSRSFMLSLSMGVRAVARLLSTMKRLILNGPTTVDRSANGAIMNKTSPMYKPTGLQNVPVDTGTVWLPSQDREITPPSYSRLFVYGSLKTGGPMHANLEREKYICKDETLPNFTMLDLGSFPGVVSKGTTSIKGEVYIVDKDSLEVLDMIEGVDEGMYVRMRFPTKKFPEAYMYLLSPRLAAMNKKLAKRWEVIESGEWQN